MENKRFTARVILESSVRVAEPRNRFRKCRVLYVRFRLIWPIQDSLAHPTDVRTKVGSLPLSAERDATALARAGLSLNSVAALLRAPPSRLAADRPVN